MHPAQIVKDAADIFAFAKLACSFMEKFAENRLVLFAVVTIHFI